MWVCYVIALVPVVGGGVLWLSTRRITFREWMKGSVIGFLVAAAFHVYTVKTQTLDYETWSGLAVRAAHRPSCLVGEGEHKKHVPEHWTVTVDLGREREVFEISREEFETLRSRFGGELTSERPSDVRVRDEDYRVEVVRNRTGVVVPAHTFRTFENRVKAGPSVFSFREPPEELPLHAYPTGTSSGELRMFLLGEAALKFGGESTIPTDLQVFDWRRSRRLLGRAAENFTIEAWDRLNAEVGPAVGVNLIAIGFDGDSSLAHWQEAKWLGGKKNDLVICYGPAKPDGEPAWTYCFGWSEDELVRRNLESLLLASPPGDALLPAIRDEVVVHYRRRSWPDFDTMTVEPPRGAILTLILIMVLVQGGYWVLAYFNRARRAAADEGEEEEVKVEQAIARAKAYDRSERKRIRENLPHLEDLEDERALTREVLEGKEPYAACLALRRLPDRRGATGLVLGLTSNRCRVREMAGRWLDEHVADPSGSAEARAAVPALIERLAHPKAVTRREARRVLDLVEPGWAARPEARKGVEELLSELDAPEPREARLDALAARGGEAVEPLLARLAERNGPAPLLALRTLGGTRDPRAVEPLADHLSGPDEDLRRAAAEGLSRFGPALADHPAAERLWERLEAALSSGDPALRRPVVGALGWLWDERALPFLVPLLSRGDPKLRPRTIEALGRLGSPAAIGPLAARLSDAKHEESVALVSALGAIGDREIIPPLIAFFEERKNGGSLVPETIVHALFPLGGEEVERLLEGAASDFMNLVNELAGMRLRQLREGFVSPGWDLTAGTAFIARSERRPSSPAGGRRRSACRPP